MIGVLAISLAAALQCCGRKQSTQLPDATRDGALLTEPFAPSTLARCVIDVPQNVGACSRVFWDRSRGSDTDMIAPGSAALRDCAGARDCTQKLSQVWGSLHCRLAARTSSHLDPCRCFSSSLKAFVSYPHAILSAAPLMLHAVTAPSFNPARHLTRPPCPGLSIPADQAGAGS